MAATSRHRVIKPVVARATIVLLIILSMIACTIAPINAQVTGSDDPGTVTGYMPPSAPDRSSIDSINASNFSTAPLNPEFIAYQQNFYGMESASSYGHTLGLIPEPVDLSYLKGRKIPQFQALEIYPSKYDLRSIGKVTSVKDQSTSGSCWAHATYASIESYLLPSETLDFSENNLKNSHGFDPDPNDGGGNVLMSMAYLTRWSGPIAEVDDPYAPLSVSSPAGLPIQKHVQNVLLIPTKASYLDNDNIKWSVMNYGAVYTSFFVSEGFCGSYDDGYYDPQHSSFYYYGSSSGSAGGHAVAIVGWDDSYSMYNFSTTAPGNGAYIVKNSWGDGWGDDGYFYVSYYDNFMGLRSNAVFTAEPLTNYDNVYQYDRLGYTNSYGFSSNTGWFANIFKADSYEQLTSVGFYALEINTAYAMYIYNNDTLLGTKSGIISSPGYYTIPLDSEIQLYPGEKFCIEVRITTPGYNYPIAIEYPISGYSSGSAANASESWVSADGQVWYDITSDCANTNVCLKAYTRDMVGISPKNIDLAEDGTSSYAIVMRSQPSNSVMVNIHNNSWVNVDRSYVVFDPSNWNVPQYVEVSVKDSHFFGNYRSSNIVHTIVTADPIYSASFASDVSVSISKLGDSAFCAISGSVMDQNGNGVGGTTVKLHIIGTSGREIGSMSTTTSTSQPFVGSFSMDNIPVTPETSYGYVTASSGSMNGSSSICILEGGATTVASILLESPSDDYTASVIGTVCDSYGTAYGGVPVTLHITDSAGIEISTAQTITSSSQPYVGVYEFSHVALPEGALFGYVTSSAQISGTYTASGASNDFYLDPFGTATANIVLQVPYYSTDVFSWSGMVTDSQNCGYGGLPITIHAMNESRGEIYNATRTSSSSQPFVGFFVFDHLSLPQDADYAYVNSTAQLTDDIVVNGESRGIYLKKERTVAGNIVLNLPSQYTVGIVSEKDTIVVDGESSWIVAQLYLNGLQYKCPNIPVTFTSDNDTVATLPSVKTNITDTNGQAWILLTSRNASGIVNVTAVAQIAPSISLTDKVTINVNPKPVPDAIIISDTLPSTLVKGQTTSVSITVQNTGNTPWTEASQMRLAAVGNTAGDAYKFGVYRVALPAGVSVAPGDQYTFIFDMTAPSAVGTYNPQFRMVWEYHQWFGVTGGKSISVASTPVYNATIIKDTIPTSMTPGQSLPVSVTVQNNGNTPWTEASQIRLGAVGNAAGDANKFGVYRVCLPEGTTVNPGQQYTFSFDMTAPSAVGTYNPQFRMVWEYHQWFGQTDSRSIAVSSNSIYNAVIVSDTIPATMTAGQPVPVSITVQNTGNQPWTEANQIRLGAVGNTAGDANKFGVYRVCLPEGTTVYPGSQYTFNFTMTAPAAAGTYNPQFRMVWEYHQWFGVTGGKSVSVAAVVYNAAIVSDTIPATMRVGQSMPVSITMRNTGNIPWTEASQIRLGAMGNTAGDANKFGVYRVMIPEGTTVNPGDEYTFSFDMTAPAAAGTYNPQFRMVWEYHQWFGQLDSKTVNVAAPVYNAAIVSDTIPLSMASGQTSKVSITVQNTGNLPWTEANQIRLGAVGNTGGDANKFGVYRVNLPEGTIVNPGEQYTFSLDMTAPAAAGTYNPQFRMVWEYHQWFGQLDSKTVTVPVVCNAVIVEDTIPASMTAGKTYPVSITVQNTGNLPWTEASQIRLGAVGNTGGDANKFGVYRVNLPVGTTVAPGEQYTFTFNMVAPGTPGTYTPQFRMVWEYHQWFGQTDSETITVMAAPVYNAVIVTDTIPSLMMPGESVPVTITVQNTGNQPWTEASQIRLGAVGNTGGDAYMFGVYRVPLPAGTTIAPGAQYTFSFTMTAPYASDTYNPQLRMVWENRQWFGQIDSKSVAVGTPAADLVSGTISPTMVAGQQYPVSVTMKNTGILPWSETSQIRLGAYDNTSGEAYEFGTYRIYLPAGTTVTPGSQYTFNFQVTAPSSPRTYLPEWQMVWENHQWFGPTVGDLVNVAPQGASVSNVHGYIVDYYNNRFPGVLIILQSTTDSDVYYITVTDSNGDYTLPGIPYGSYELDMYVSGDPYSPWYVNVDVNSYDTIKNIRIPIVQPSGSASAFVSLDGILDMQAIESMHQLSKGKGVQLEPLTE